MNKKYPVKEILNAVNLLLKEEEKVLLLKDEEKVLKLENEINNSKRKTDNIPKSTEKIILQAEKYLKK
ncbi:MAG: hypothetical protein HVK32_00650 [Pelagibacteraceae bacterium]|jgi:hypothetical protein|nr:hypothetical protein [Pelagibacteraceae bacterium]MBO6481910.1 hypothetical protein [Pelagibacteraceae bacterium]MBO6483801.1 hypothetical protein [Pelagibacteraceae bacterium]MBO6484228.1 hypothetical protein [Pelagibacteraceae bacterium]MBO6487176.1 hypothetical protein [Pelagibacteraceae bacterium]